MPLDSLCLRTDFPNPARLETYQTVRDGSGLGITIQSPCTIKAAKLGKLLQEAFEQGSLPAATEVLARHVEEANQHGTSLICTLVARL